jgi:hypothetical protein
LISLFLPCFLLFGSFWLCCLSVHRNACLICCREVDPLSWRKYREFCGIFCCMPDILVCQDLGFPLRMYLSESPGMYSLPEIVWSPLQSLFLDAACQGDPVRCFFPPLCIIHFLLVTFSTAQSVTEWDRVYTDQSSCAFPPSQLEWDLRVWKVFCKCSSRKFPRRMKC